VTDDAGDHATAEEPGPPAASDFDEGFAAAEVSCGLRRVWRAAEPDLPPEIEPFSFVSRSLLNYVAAALALSPGSSLVDLACGRGGPGMWLAKTTGAELTGVDFSSVAVGHATQRAGLFGLTDRARFVVGNLEATGLPDGIFDAAVCIDAFHMPADMPRAAGEAFRILRRGGRLVLTDWQPRTPGDDRLSPRWRAFDWTRLLRDAGFVEIVVEARPEWHETFTRVYRTALDIGDPDGDPGLAALQDEARRRLTEADLVDRVVVTARRPLG
jgi:ubiquinone/menaquinone biosynthesis C-methylase UbiE